MGAFTTIAPRKANALVNSVTLSYGSKSVEVLALWDTGATSSCIASELSEALGMRQVGKRRIPTPSGMADVPHPGHTPPNKAVSYRGQWHRGQCFCCVRSILLRHGHGCGGRRRHLFEGDARIACPHEDEGVSVGTLRELISNVNIGESHNWVLYKG
jgi:hypothetical protein